VFTIQINFLHGFSTQTPHKSNKWKVLTGRLDGLCLTLFVNLSFSTDGQNMILKIDGNPSLSVSLSLSVLMVIFSRWTCVSRFLLELRMIVVSGDNWSYKTCKAPVKCHHQQTNTQLFYRLDVLPVTQSTVSEHWRENSCPTVHSNINMNDSAPYPMKVVLCLMFYKWKKRQTVWVDG